MDREKEYAAAVLTVDVSRTVARNVNAITAPLLPPLGLAARVVME